MTQTLVLDKEKAKVDHAYFAEKLTNFKCFDYQDKIDWSNNRILIYGGRRTGKDTLVINRRIIPFLWTGYCPVRKKVFTAPKIGVYAPGWEEADVFMDILRDSLYETALEKSIVIDNKFDITLSNRARLICRIANKLSTGKRGRGFDLLYMTEASFIADEDLAIIRPTRLIGSAPEILASSPNGENHFSNAIESGVYKVYGPWSSYMNPMIKKKDLDDEKKLMTNIEFRQEIMGEILSGEGQAIPDTLIRKMYERKGLELIDKAREGKFYVGGVDLGRRRDKSTVYVLEVDFPNVTIVYYKEFTINKKDPRFWVKVIEHTIWVADIFHLSRLKIDQTGIGDMPTVEIKRAVAEKSIPCVVEGVDFTFALKHKWEGLINQAVLKFERYEISAPLIHTLVVQLKSIRWNNKTKMYDTRGPSPDHVMALFLAISCVGNQRYYFGTASNKSSQENPLIEPNNDNLKEKVESGYAMKASELEPG